MMPQCVRLSFLGIAAWYFQAVRQNPLTLEGGRGTAVIHSTLPMRGVCSSGTGMFSCIRDITCARVDERAFAHWFLNTSGKILRSSSRLLIWCWATGEGGDFASGSTRWAVFQPYFVAAAAFNAESSRETVSKILYWHIAS